MRTRLRKPFAPGDMSRGAQVYEDVPLEMFRDPLPPWPLGRSPRGDTMSYSRDRSAGSRGVGAVASRDLREGGGGAKVRTARGVVTLVPSAEKRVSRWGGRLPFGDTGLVRSAFPDAQNPTNRGYRRRVTTSLPVVIRSGGPLSPSRQAPWLDGEAVNYAHPQVVSAGYGGRGRMGGGGGGIPMGLGATFAPTIQVPVVPVMTAARWASIVAALKTAIKKATAALAAAKITYNPAAIAAATAKLQAANLALKSFLQKFPRAPVVPTPVPKPPVVAPPIVLPPLTQPPGAAVPYGDQTGFPVADGARSSGSVVTYGDGTVASVPPVEEAPSYVKPPIPTSVKIAAAAGAGWLLLSMLGKGH